MTVNDLKKNEILNSSYYEKFGWRFEQYDTKPCGEIIQKIFTAHAAKNSHILDIGAGPGHFALWMKEQGHHVDCLTPETYFVEKCKEKGLTCYQSHLYSINSTAVGLTKKYDLTVALCWPFSHIPLEKAEESIKIVHDQLLKSNGLFIIGLFMGTQGNHYDDPMNLGHQRFYVHHTDESFRTMIQPYFEVVASGDHKYSNSIKRDVAFYVLRKRS